MRLPSIKTLAAVFGENAKEARRVLEMPRKELTTHTAGAARVRECWNSPSTDDVRMHVLNALAGTHGVESVEITFGEYADYLNVGDTYCPTVICWQGRYRVQDMGTFIERNQRGVKC